MSSVNINPDDADGSVDASPEQGEQVAEFASGKWDTDAALPPEFPVNADIWPEHLSRRRFLSLMGASLGLAGLHGCARPPDEKIVPYVKQPELIVPGKPLYFATASSLGGASTGLLVKSQMGRPIKVEGNPKHPSVPAAHGLEDDPARPGACDIFSQAAVLSLYDPDRSQVVTQAGQISTWSAFLSELRRQFDAQPAKEGHGIRVLTETIGSPTLQQQLRNVEKWWPHAWVQYEPVNRDHEAAGAWVAFGEAVDTHYHVERADVILSIDADFLACGPDHLQHARRFARRRQLRATGKAPAEMNRLYALRTSPTLTGSVADHVLSLRQFELELFIQALASRLGVNVQPAERELSDAQRRWLDVLASDLRGYRRRNDPGASLVIPGLWQPPQVHALAHAINQILGNVGTTVSYTASADKQPDAHAAAEQPPRGQTDALRALVGEMRAGRVKALFILGGNPAYAAPADLDFAGAMARVPFIVHLSAYQDETSLRSHWHLPEAHFLESWSDARASDGSVSIVQPLIAPLYQGKSAHELLAAMLGEPARSAHDIVKQHWKAERGGDGFEDFWQTALHDGVLPDTQWPRKEMPLRKDFRARFEASAAKDKAPGAGEGVDIVFRPDPTVWDGRFANNGWLQELPKPLTKLTWDNAALIGPALGKRLELAAGDMVQLEYDGRQIQIPVWIVPGHPDNSVTVHLGHGRSRAGRVGNGVGFNAFQIRTSDAPWFAHGAAIRKKGQRHPLACTQRHPGIEEQHVVEERKLVPNGTLEQFQRNPQQPPFMPPVHELPSLYARAEQSGYQWGMSIDLSSCVGCNACVIACQAENNIPVVGQEQVALGRQMQWIRIDTYYGGEGDSPAAFHQPVPCMHCENAPCEVVCPVAATVHSAEGLNEMVYNRCVGTRYCSNNCPYKVRRFNFLQYSDLHTPSLKLLHNPEVTVRNRGVMEKCTYCVQRISAARIEAEKEGRRIRDGELATACQAACPTQAIAFGDLNDPKSEVRALKELPLDYALLGELNTRPRTTYLAAVKNPNALLAKSTEGNE